MAEKFKARFIDLNDYDGSYMKVVDYLTDNEGTEYISSECSEIIKEFFEDIAVCEGATNFFLYCVSVKDDSYNIDKRNCLRNSKVLVVREMGDYYVITPDYDKVMNL